MKVGIFVTGLAAALLANAYADEWKPITDADQLKARLVLSGLEASLQKVTIEGRGNFYRVRLGPYVSVARLTEVDRRLSEQGIKALRLKVSKGG